MQRTKNRRRMTIAVVAVAVPMLGISGLAMAGDMPAVEGSDHPVRISHHGKRLFLIESIAIGDVRYDAGS